MAEAAAIQALSSIATPAGESRRVEVPSGCAPLWDWFSPGQVLELSDSPDASGGAARSSVAARLMAQAQAQAEPVVWVEGSVGLYPPDLAAVGVDLDALVVVRPGVDSDADPGPEKRARSAAQRAVRAAEVLLRSGAFGLLVLDLSEGVPARTTAWLSKLHGLLRLHASRLLVLSASAANAPSLGPSVSLRIEPRVRRLSADRWVIEHAVLKNKLGQQVRVHPDVRVAPEGAAPLGPTLSKEEHETARCA